MSALSKPEPSRSLQVEILDLRHFSSVDLRPLLEDEVREAMAEGWVPVGGVVIDPPDEYGVAYLQTMVSWVRRV